MFKPCLNPPFFHVVFFFLSHGNLDGNSEATNCPGADALDQTFAAQDLEDSELHRTFLVLVSRPMAATWSIQKNHGLMGFNGDCRGLINKHQGC